MPTLHIDNFQKGTITARAPFLIPNESFAKLENAICVDGRVERKGGYKSLGVTSLSTIISVTSNSMGVFALSFTVPTGESDYIIPGSITFTIGTSPNTTTYKDVQNGKMFLDPLPSDGIASGTVDYVNKLITIPGLLNVPASITFSRSPCLPILEFFELGKKQYCIDYKYFYELISDRLSIGFGKNLVKRQTYLHSNLDFTWSGATSADFRGFSGIENHSKLYVTNSRSGRYFMPITAVTLSQTTTITINPRVDGVTQNFLNNIIAAAGRNLKVFIFGTRGSWALNSRTANVTSVTGGANMSPLTVTLDINGSSITSYTSHGILQFLNVGSDDMGGIKVFDGSGWTNFMPPLTSPGVVSSSSAPSISNPLQVTYLVGCDFFVNFFGIFIAFGTREATADGDIDYDPVRIRYNIPITSPGYFTDAQLNSTAISTWYNATDRPSGYSLISTIGRQFAWAEIVNNRCVIGVDTGAITLTFDASTPTSPLILSLYDSDLGALSLRSSVHLDNSILAIGPQGILRYQPRASLLKSLFEVSRMDQEVYDFIEDVNFDDPYFISTSRDTVSQFIYLNYVSRDSAKFPDKAILFNYKDQTFAVLKEKATAQAKFSFIIPEFLEPTWSSLPENATWETVRDSRWSDFKSRSSLKSETVIGTSQGLVLQRFNQRSLPVADVICTNITNSNNITVLTCPNHSLNTGDFIQIKEALGVTFADNRTIFKVERINDNTINIDGDFTGTYAGGAVVRVIENFSIRTKEFAVGWQESKKLSLHFVRFLIESLDIRLPLVLNIYTDHNRTAPVFTETLSATNNNFINTGTFLHWLKSNNAVVNNSVQFELTLSEETLKNSQYSDEGFKLHAINLMLEFVGELA